MIVFAVNARRSPAESTNGHCASSTSDGRSAADADRLGVAAGDRVVLTTKAGSAEVAVEPTERMRSGHVSLPNGFGLSDAGDGSIMGNGIAPND